MLKDTKIESVPAYSDEITRRDMVALYITPVITGAIFYLINNYSTNPKEDQNIKKSISQSLPDTDSYTSLLMPLFYPFIGAVVTMFIVNLWLAQDSAYKSKKELYMDLQKVYRVKRNDTSIMFSDASNDKDNLYRFRTIDEKIKLLTKCIADKVKSNYIK